MDAPSTTFRPAKPSLEEGKVSARYLDQAAEGFFGFMLGPRSEEILAKAFTEPEHDLSYQNVTFAERDNRVVGMVSGYTGEQHHSFSNRTLQRATGRYNLRFQIVSLVFAPFLRIIDTVMEGEFYLQAIAVDQEMRGEGIGSDLMDWIEQRAIDSGSSRLVLDVSADNHGARRFYERRGMSVESQWPKRVAIPKLRLLRIKKDLSSL